MIRRFVSFLVLAVLVSPYVFSPNAAVPIFSMEDPQNQTPVADAGSDQTVHVGDVVHFNGSGSYDPDAGWEITTVDSVGFVGWGSSLALDGNDYPRISYNDHSKGKLKYAKWTGSSWVNESVGYSGGPGLDANIALDSKDNPHISYLRYSSHRIQYAVWNGSAWTIEDIDWSPNSLYSSIAVDSKDNPHIGLYDAYNGWFKHAERNETAWNIEIVESKTSSGAYSSIALDTNDYPHFSYFDFTREDLKYTRWNGTGWIVETVDSEGRVGKLPSLALDSQGYPHISYSGWDFGLNWTESWLKYAKWTGANWSIETVDPGGEIGGWSSMDLDMDDNPHMSYLDYANGDLKYARWLGTEWHIEVVDSTGDVGWFSSLELDRDENPHISYLDLTNEDLKYAKKTGGIVSYEWDFGDGSPLGTGIDPTHIYTALGIYNIILTVTDTQGATDSDNCTITVLQSGQPPVADAGGPYFGSEGSQITLDASKSYDPDGDELEYRWDFNADGVWDTNWLSSPFVNHTWGDDHKGTVALQVSTLGSEVADIVAEGDFNWFSDLNWMNKRAQSFMPHTSTLSKIAVDVSVSWGEPDADLYLYVRESLDGPNITFAHLSPDGLPHDRYVSPEDWPEFDFPDLSVEPGKTYYFVLTSPMQGGGNYEIHFGDDFYPGGISYYRHVTNDSWVDRPYWDLRFGTYGPEMLVSEPAIAEVAVSNIAPTVKLMATPIEADVSLRMAGEKWHDVTIEMFEDGEFIAGGTLVRYPGSPDDQRLDLSQLQVNHLKKYSAIVRYMPEDDPINGQPNGANPCWIILNFSDGEELWIHHTFNVQHPESHVWEIDLTAAILMHGLTFQATAFDPGADDLTLNWDFGDGTIITTFYANTNNTYPVQIRETFTHTFPGSGTYTVTVTVEDDDGGKGTATFTLNIP